MQILYIVPDRYCVANLLKDNIFNKLFFIYLNCIILLEGSTKLGLKTNKKLEEEEDKQEDEWSSNKDLKTKIEFLFQI